MCVENGLKECKPGDKETDWKIIFPVIHDPVLFLGYMSEKASNIWTLRDKHKNVHSCDEYGSKKQEHSRYPLTREWLNCGIFQENKIFYNSKNEFSSIQFSSVTQSCPTICDPMNCSTPGLPVHHQLLEFTQIHVHWVNDAIQPSHPLSSPSPPALNLSQHQGLFQQVSSSHQVAKVLDLQHQSFQWIVRVDSL